MASKTTKTIEYGDFQTPEHLAMDIAKLLKNVNFEPKSIIEPTCGTGVFIKASLEHFPNVKQVWGLDINPEYIETAKKVISPYKSRCKINFTVGDFFSTDFQITRKAFLEPILIIGNPPWVTNTAMSAIRGSNLPTKSNILKLNGLAAKTGQSNFDISESIILHLLNDFQIFNGKLAMICKAKVGRKILLYASKERIPISGSEMFLIDSNEFFSTNVSSCVFISNLTRGKKTDYSCRLYSSVKKPVYLRDICYIDQRLVSNPQIYKKYQYLSGTDSFIWRSGVKHDCTKILVLKRKDNKIVNGLKEKVNIEDKFLFPLLKASDIANGRTSSTNKWIIIPQRRIGEETSTIEYKAPKTWEYLLSHEKFFSKRRSSVYNNQPRFSIFGLGSYTFAKWKIAIAGLYKNIVFRIVGPLEGKPVIFDDTCYFLPFDTEKETQTTYELLTTKKAQNFLESLIFWDNKRPITKEILESLNLDVLAKEVKF